MMFTGYYKGVIFEVAGTTEIEYCGLKAERKVYYPLY